MFIQSRIAIDKDVFYIHSLEIENYNEEKPWNIEDFRGLVKGNAGEVFVIEDECLIGYVAVYVTDVVYIANLCIKKEKRKHGYAKKLLTYVENYYIDKSLVLEVRFSNKIAIELYKKLGYRQIHVRKSMYEYPVEDGLVMSKEN